MLMRQVFKMEIIIQKAFIKKFGQKNTLIVSADIENQINQLENEEKEKLYGNDWIKKNWFKYANPKRL